MMTTQTADSWPASVPGAEPELYTSGSTYLRFAASMFAVFTADQLRAAIGAASPSNETLVRLAGALDVSWKAEWLNEPDAFPER